MNLPAVGYDDESTIYFAASGTGTELDPFISVYRIDGANQLAQDNTLQQIVALIPQFIFDDGKLQVQTNLNPLTLTQLQSITVKVEEQNPLSFDGLASEYNQNILSNKVPDGLTVVNNKLQVDVGTPTVRNNPVAATTPTLTNVASSATSVTLLAANSNRKMVIILNDSTAILYISFGTSAASTSNLSFAIQPIANSIPSFVTFSGSDYAGEIRGIWSSANGFARITEVV